jgi:pimeloyl-ACP methyl ester carboxylesterase
MRLGARARAATVVLVVVAAAAGCAQTAWVRVREVPANPLAGPLQLLSPGGPKPTDRTMLVLRRYDLEDDLAHHDARLLANLVEIASAEPSADKLYSLSELAYLAGKRAEPISRRKALDYHGLAVVNAYQYLFDGRFGRYRNPYDPGFRGACDLYNAALESAIRIIKKQGKLVPGSTQTIQTASQTVETTIVLRSKTWRAEDFANFRFVSDYEIRGLQNQYHTYGLGVPLIAERKHHNTAAPQEKFYPPGMSFPVTAFLRVMPGGNQGQGHYVVHLELYDPLNTSEISVDGRRVPLESDLTTPLAYALNQKELQDLESSTAGLLNPAKAARLQGLYMLEPYQPGKIPVLMIHGLWSSPITWMEMFNDLRGSPEIRDRYQFWFYLYPTGQPFWHSAAQMRRDLAEARQVIDPYKRQAALDQMVLVGHSMGGLVARLQTIDSGNDFWNVVSEKPFDVINASYDAKRELADTFFFRPDRAVRRVITIGTPFRGSEFSNSTTRWIGSKLIKIPQMLVNGRQQLFQENPDYFRKNNLIDVDTSIDSLAPDSPILPVMAGARAAPWVRHHNVVGRTSKRSFLSRVTGDGDGVVSYDSAHLEGAASEVVIDADHLKIHRHPLAVLEVHRLLLLHLAEIDAGGPRRPQRLPWTAAAPDRPAPPNRGPSGSPPSSLD